MERVFTQKMAGRILERNKRELLRRLAAVPDEIEEAFINAATPEEALRIWREAFEAVLNEAESWDILDVEPLRTIREEASRGLIEP